MLIHGLAAHVDPHDPAHLVTNPGFYATPYSAVIRSARRSPSHDGGRGGHRIRFRNSTEGIYQR